MNVLVINAGSSSVKFVLFAMEADAGADGAPGKSGAHELQSGVVERVGSADASLSIVCGAAREQRPVAALDPRAAVALVLDEVARAGHSVDAVGHRVVHGGERFTASVRLDDDVLAGVRACVPLAPLHNPANLSGIEAVSARHPATPQVAVFDTAFHQTMPKEAFVYALPTALYADKGVRRYGFHGTSHRYVARRAAALLGKQIGALKLVTLHLGNGCSACAVDGGLSIDTSMGMTPLEGLVMGTRSGDVDPAVVLELARDLGVDGAARLLNRGSGLLGLSGTSHDLRDLEAAALAGDEAAQLALAVFARRVKKTLGAYAALLGRLDAVVFTGGIGENGALMRARICAGLDVIGVALDDTRNQQRGGGERDIAGDGARARVLVVPTEEESLEIARDTWRLTAPPR